MRKISGLVRLFLAMGILAASPIDAPAMAGSRNRNAAPQSTEVDKCGHRVVRDRMGDVLVDPVCDVVSDHLNPPLYRLPRECDRGVTTYDLGCILLRTLTIESGPPKTLI